MWCISVKTNETYSDDAEEVAELVGLGVVELLTQGAEDVLDLGEGDFAAAVLVEDLLEKIKRY